MSFTYFAASVGHRYGDACQTFVALDPSRDDIVSTSTGRKVEELAEQAAAFEAEEIYRLCEENEFYCSDGVAEDCTCGEDVVTFGMWPQSARDLFTAEELREHRRDLMAGKVVVLYK